MKVLVVEDEDALAESLLKGLAREGFEVARAATGGAALEHGEADVVLLDLRLPDMDGLDVCKAIRARSAVPIIIVSARGEEADRVVGLELGAITSSSRSDSARSWRGSGRSRDELRSRGTSTNRSSSDRWWWMCAPEGRRLTAANSP